MIKSWWYKGDGNNFGDVLGPILLYHMTSTSVTFSNDPNTLATIGSIAYYSFRAPMVLWGSGAISEHVENPLVQKHKFLAVRGPKTRQKILATGGSCPEVYGDPALLLPTIFSKDRFEISQRSKVSFLPHWIDYNLASKMRSVKSGEVNLIDIRGNVFDTIKQIVASDFIITSSLHGLIVAEAYDIPVVFARFSNNVTGGYFKFEDYFNSTNRDLNFLDHRGNLDDLLLDECFKTYDQKEQFSFNLAPLVESFPFEITHKGILALREG